MDTCNTGKSWQLARLGPRTGVPGSNMPNKTVRSSSTYRIDEVVIGDQNELRVRLQHGVSREEEGAKRRLLACRVQRDRGH